MKLEEKFNEKEQMLFDFLSIVILDGQTEINIKDGSIKESEIRSFKCGILSVLLNLNLYERQLKENGLSLEELSNFIKFSHKKFPL